MSTTGTSTNNAVLEVVCADPPEETKDDKLAERRRQALEDAIRERCVKSPPTHGVPQLVSEYVLAKTPNEREAARVKAMAAIQFKMPLPHCVVDVQARTFLVQYRQAVEGLGGVPADVRPRRKAELLGTGYWVDGRSSSWDRIWILDWEIPGYALGDGFGLGLGQSLLYGSYSGLS
ncbi:hypothetical protein HK104_010456 [Borealophlyctis nickersoniae]|nr:hypothetical protein HK104_010456 [Borealophlyctis nickersoniae]